MKKEIADRLSREYSNLWDDSMRAVPDGWITPLVSMLDKLYRLSDVDRKSYQGEGLGTWVNLRVEVQLSGAFAFATPMISAGRWHGERALECIEALNEFHNQTQETCEVCGNPGAFENGRVSCIGCAGDDFAAQARKAEALYQEVRELFPKVHGSAIDLAVPDHLSELLASTLRSILKLVRSEDIVGKVLITRVEMDDGALYVRVRYNDLTAVFMGVQMAVNEMISDLETLSDEATRKHHQGGSDAS